LEDLELSPAPYKSSVSPLCIQQDFKKPRKKTMPAFFGLEEQGRCCSTTPTTVDAADASILPPPSRRPPLPPTPDSVTGPSTQAAAGFGSDAPSAGTPTAPPSSSEQHGGRRGGPATALAEELSARLRLDDESGDSGEEDEPAVASPARSFASDFGDEAERVLESLTVSRDTEKTGAQEEGKFGRANVAATFFPFARRVFFSASPRKKTERKKLTPSTFSSLPFPPLQPRRPRPLSRRPAARRGSSWKGEEEVWCLSQLSLLLPLPLPLLPLSPRSTAGGARGSALPLLLPLLPPLLLPQEQPSLPDVLSTR